MALHRAALQQWAWAGTVQESVIEAALFKLQFAGTLIPSRNGVWWASKCHYYLFWFQEDTDFIPLALLWKGFFSPCCFAFLAMAYAVFQHPSIYILHLHLFPSAAALMQSDLDVTLWHLSEKALMCCWDVWGMFVRIVRIECCTVLNRKQRVTHTCHRVSEYTEPYTDVHFWHVYKRLCESRLRVLVHIHNTSQPW